MNMLSLFARLSFSPSSRASTPENRLARQNVFSGRKSLGSSRLEIAEMPSTMLCSWPMPIRLTARGMLSTGSGKPK